MTANTENKDLSQYGLTLADLYKDAIAFNGQIVSDDISEDDEHVRMVTLYDGKKDNFYIRIEEIVRKTPAPYSVEFVSARKYEWFATTFAGSRFATVECPVPKAVARTKLVPSKDYAHRNPMAYMSTKNALDYFSLLRDARSDLEDALRRINENEMEDFDYAELRAIMQHLKNSANDLQMMKAVMLSCLDSKDIEEVEA